VTEVSVRAAELARGIYNLLEQDRQKLIHSAGALRLHEVLSFFPIITAQEVSPATAGRSLKQLVDQGILVEITGNSRNRKFIYRDYLNLLND
jgi:Fic family protein